MHGPAGEAWASMTERGPDEALTCPALPGVRRDDMTASPGRLARTSR